MHPGKRKEKIALNCIASRCAIFIVCCLAPLLACTLSSGREWSLHLFTAPLALLFVISILTIALPKWLRITLQILFGESILAVCLVESYCLYEFLSEITPRIFALIANTDSREAGEFFSTYIKIKMLSDWCIDITLLAIILLPTSYLFEHRIKKLFNKSFLQGRTATIILFVTIAVVLSFEVPSFLSFTHTMKSNTSQQKTEMQMFNGIQQKLYTPLHRLYFSWYVNNQSEKTLSSIRQSCQKSTIEGCSYRSPHIVLIIGESYNKHHSHLYGYNLNTTPRQQQRRDNGELFPFTNAVTPWNITNNVMMSIFSLWDNSCGDMLGNYPLFPILFRRAGYEVRFVTNQFKLHGILRGFSNKAGNFFLTDVTLSDSLFSFRNKRSYTLDMELINAFKAHLDTCKHNDVNTNYSLDIIHLLGQHFEYNKRYPNKLAHFTLNDYKNRNLDDEAKTTVMHYDNATFYNDIVIDSILMMYEQMNAIVIYLSDHGDQVWDDGSTHDRTFHTPGTVAARYEYEVPFWIWCSDSYRTSHHDIVEQIKDALNRPFLTDDLPQLLLYIAGINSHWNRPERNILSPSYSPKHRLIDGDTDYDLIIKN